MTPPSLLSRWQEAHAFAFKVAKSEHAARLGGPAVKSYDERGVHVFSAAWAEQDTLAKLLATGALHAADGPPDDAPLFGCSPSELRRAAEADALADFENDRYEDWRLRFLREQAEAGAAA